MLDPEEFEETMMEISQSFMPFGKYGPDNYPPRGVPIYDLPFEYLDWFQYNGDCLKGILVSSLKSFITSRRMDPMRHFLISEN